MKVLALFLLAVGAWAAPAVSVLGVTNQQAILTIQSDGSSCAVQAYEDISLTKVVHDVDESLFSGSSQCSRRGSIIQGNNIQFILGARGTATAADGNVYSRSLQLEKTYYVKVIFGSGKVAVTMFTTQNQQLGDSAPDYIPFNPKAFGGWGWPSIDYTQSKTTGVYVDPLHGRPLYRISAPGDGPYFENINQPMTATDLSGGKWAIPSTSFPTSNGSSVFKYTGNGGEADSLLLTPTWIPIPGGNHGYDSLTALDDLLLKLQGFGNNLWACLVIDGKTCFSKAVSLNFPSTTTPGEAYSSSTYPSPILNAWGSPKLTATQMGNLAIKVWKVSGTGSVSLLSGVAVMNASHNFGTEAQGQGATGCGGPMQITKDENGNPLNPALTGFICTVVDSQGDNIQKIWTPDNGQIWKLQIHTGSSVVDPTLPPDFYTYASEEVQKCYYDLPNSATNCTALQTQQTITQEIASAHPEIDTNYYGQWNYRGSSYPYFLFTSQPGQNHGYWTCQIDVTQPVGSPQVVECHNSWGQYPLRWETSHSQGGEFVSGNYVEAFQNFGMTSSGDVGAGEYTLNILRVYTDGLKGTVASDTSLQQNFYDPNTCAALGVTDQRWLSEASNGANSCVVLDVAGEPLNLSPPSVDLSPYGTVQVGTKPQASQGNGAYSFLQPMQEGDWFGDSYNTGQSERFLIAKKTILSNGTIQLVVIRNPTAFWQSNGTDYHGAGWVPFMAPPLLPGNSCGGVYYAPLGKTPNWIEDNPSIWCGHQATWQTGGKEIHVGVQAGWAGNGTLPDALGGWFTGYGIRYGKVPDVWGPTGLQYVQQGQYPFAGSLNQITAGFQQTHPGGDTWAAPSREQGWAVDGRPYGPAGGSPYGLQLWKQTLTLVSGQTSTYKITLPIDDSGNVLFENSGSGPKWTANFDLKRRGIHAWSGFHLLQNLSGPGSVISDATPWSHCEAMVDGECVTGSKAGDIYVSVPGANTNGYCWEGDGEINAPCITVAGPEMGGYEQFGISHWDPFGLEWRNLTMAFNGPGRVTDFANMHGKSTGDYGFAASFWADGRRSDVFAVKLGDWPSLDTINRTQFVPVQYSFTAPTTAQYRVRFGYAEYGLDQNSQPLFCSPNRMEDCTTAPANADPYAFASEPQKLQSCTQGKSCTISIPATSQRVLYFVVDSTTDGKTFTSGPLQVTSTN